ncbi:MAG: Stage sporulation protein [Chlamydiota bacterium]|jgi:cell division protein FtsW
MSKRLFGLVISGALLFVIGLLMVFNTTSAEMIDRAQTSGHHAPLLKQMAYGCIGIVGGLCLYRIGYQRVIALSWPLLILVTILLVAIFIPGVGQSINGSRRWLSIFGYSFQPSEALKIVLPAVYIRWYISRTQEVGWRELLLFLAKVFVPIGLILIEPDHGTPALLFTLIVALCWLTQIRMIFWALPLAVCLVLGAFSAYQLPYVRNRIEIYLHPELDLLGKGHQPHQAKIAAGSGGVLGRGLGQSLQKMNYLPEARSDYIAAIYAEEMGFIGMLGLIALYALFALSGFTIALQCPDRAGFWFAAALTFLISIQAFLNLGIVSGLLPSKGMTLPFFSQGGSSLIVNMGALALLCDIGRQTRASNLSV